MILENKEFLMIRWPGENKVSKYIFGAEESDTKIHVCPFEGEGKKYHVNSLETLDSETLGDLKCEPSRSQVIEQPKSNTRETYLNLVNTIKQGIYEGDLLKAVASRIEVQDISLHVIETFSKILNKYSGYSYLLHTKDYGTWLGASPELLLKWENQSLTSVSLAGTRKVGDDSPWTSKEDAEQEVVTRFVINNMREGGASNIIASERSIKNAGNLAHLYTRISGEVLDKTTALRILKKLHPTPALGGAPPDVAIRVLSENEGYKRQLYGGYIGLEMPEYLHCFVNIRCMKASSDKVVLFAGAGINKDSVPEEEWKETQEKLNVMRSIL